MIETAKPLWWRVGKGKWHEEPFPDAFPRWLNWAYCGASKDHPRTRRSAPPVAQQCKRCRAVKAKQRKEKGK